MTFGLGGMQPGGTPESARRPSEKANQASMKKNAPVTIC